VNRTARSRWWDGLLAAVIAVLAISEVWLPLPSVMGEGARWFSTVVAVMACAALTQRRHHPLATAAVVLLSWPLAAAVTDVLVLFWGQFVPIVLALYSVARHGSPRQQLLGAALGAGTLLWTDLTVPELGDPSEVVFHWAVSLVAFGLGLFVRSYESRAVQEARRAVRAELEGREQALRAVAEERARIARELHDIVAHSVSVMVVQAGAAEKALDDPDFVRRALDSIRTTGSGALAEMRRVVALIRDEDQPVALEPAPELGDLRRLITEMDVPTRLRIEGPQREVPPGVALAVYRIVQEALTNVRRHARADAAEVVLRFGEGRLEVEVGDDGVGSADASGGHGLIGMRERVQMYGGTLRTATRPGGGFRVHASLPCEADA
jgi:signal transduction histidine kinase